MTEKKKSFAFWTPEQKALLKADMTDKEIAKETGKTPGAVAQARRILNGYKPPRKAKEKVAKKATKKAKKTTKKVAKKSKVVSITPNVKLAAKPTKAQVKFLMNEISKSNVQISFEGGLVTIDRERLESFSTAGNTIVIRTK